jgi:hypothetical protein
MSVPLFPALGFFGLPGQSKPSRCLVTNCDKQRTDYPEMAVLLLALLLTAGATRAVNPPLAGSAPRWNA